jgi:hypothetical protein
MRQLVWVPRGICCAALALVVVAVLGGLTACATTTLAGATTGSRTAATPANLTSEAPTPTNGTERSIVTVHRVMELRQVYLHPAPEYIEVNVECPTGELALSGGWSYDQFSGAHPDFFVIASSRDTFDRWHIGVRHESPGVLRAYVMCLKPPVGVAVTMAQRSSGSAGEFVPPGGEGVASASCNRDETLVGGGFDINLSQDGKVTSMTASGPSWNVHARHLSNLDTSLLRFRVLAECLRFEGARSSFVGSSAAGTSGHATSLACSTDGHISGGGFVISPTSVAYKTAATDSSSTWEVGAHPAALAIAYAECLFLPK